MRRADGYYAQFCINVERKEEPILRRKHLKVSRQRKDFAIKTALCVVKSSDFVAYEDLQVRNMVKNHKLAKSISDAALIQESSRLQTEECQKPS